MQPEKCFKKGGEMKSCAELGCKLAGTGYSAYCNEDNCLYPEKQRKEGEKMTVKKYGRFWAVWDGEELICVTVYKKGAEEVTKRLGGIK